jgi:hypothetical protein
MSEDKIENEEETKSLEKIRDIKDNDQLQDELKEWEVESTHEGD